jgi:hypothetical protein
MSGAIVSVIRRLAALIAPCGGHMRCWTSDFNSCFDRFHELELVRRTLGDAGMVWQLRRLVAAVPGDTAECGVFEDKSYFWAESSYATIAALRLARARTRVWQALVNRLKMAFAVALDDWFRGPLRERMTCYCAGPDFEELGLRPEPIRRLWADFLSGRTYRTDLLWQLFTLAAWSRRFRGSGAARLTA